MNSVDKLKLKGEVSKFFKPGTPINKQQLFAGRLTQINDVINATLQGGRHVIMFGERGVGKTSLAQVISDMMKAASFKLLDSGTINCDPTDDFNTLWRKIFRELSFSMTATDPGFVSDSSQSKVSITSVLPNRALKPDDIRYYLSKINEPVLVIIDELDRLAEGAPRIQLADTIKNLSDHAVNATLLLVGVGDSVNELIAEHHSIQRALVQVPMQRMSRAELLQILDTGFNGAGIATEDACKGWIASLSQGLPHYTHSLGLYSAFAAIERGRTEITPDDVLEATKQIVQKSHTIATAYSKAIASPQKQNLYAQVLSACALAETNEFGWFTAAAVSKPMSQIMDRTYYVPGFARHLSEFCKPKRGPILKSEGELWMQRYRFIDAMMQPFVIIHDYSIGVLTNQFIEQSKGRLKAVEENA